MRRRSRRQTLDFRETGGVSTVWFRFRIVFHRSIDSMRRQATATAINSICSIWNRDLGFAASSPLGLAVHRFGRWP